MKRRALLTVGGACLLAAAVGSGAQTTRRPWRIGFLHPGREESFGPRFEIFRAALKELGYVEGHDISIDVRWGNDQIERLDPLAAEIAAFKPAVVVTASSAGVAACRKAMPNIPIVFMTAGNPVEQGFVASLARPGGNVTGVILHMSLTAKIVEITREALPAAQRFAILVHDTDPIHAAMVEEFGATAQRFKFQPLVVRMKTSEDLERAFRELVQRKAEALLLPNLSLLISRRREIAERAVKARLPLLSNQDHVTDSGGLLSYGTVVEENYRRGAVLVAKILRGAKPAELPVEQPERFVLVINNKTARAIGVSLSPSVVFRADRIID